MHEKSSSTLFDLSYSTYPYFLDFLSFAIILLPCYFFTRSPFWRRILLSLTGMYLLSFIAPRLVVFYLFYWCCVFFIQRFTAWKEHKGGGLGKSIFIVSLLPLIPMLAWKIIGENFVFDFNTATNAVLRSTSVWLWQLDMLRELVTLLGLSFAAFRAVDLIIKTYIGKIEALSFDKVLFYGFFPPVQIVGPVIEYEEIADQSKNIDAQDILHGLTRVCIGVIKVFVLSNPLFFSLDVLQHPYAHPFAERWLYLFLFTWYFYLNFAGYSDMALGTARLFGFRLKENFNFPFFARNIQEFWNNWHMSLTRWVQRNVFIPAGGYKKKTQYVAIFASIMTISFWHELSINSLMFGLYHFAALALHRRYADKHKATAGLDPPLKVFGFRVATYLFVTIGLGIQFSKGFSGAVQLLLSLMGVPA